MDFCETRPDLFVSSVQLIPSLEAVFSTLPSATAHLSVYSIGTARKEILSSLKLESAALPHVRSKTSQYLYDVTKSVSQYYTTISLSASRALADCMPMRFAFYLPASLWPYLLLLSALVPPSSDDNGNVSLNILNVSYVVLTVVFFT